VSKKSEVVVKPEMRIAQMRIRLTYHSTDSALEHPEVDWIDIGGEDLNRLYAREEIEVVSHAGLVYVMAIRGENLTAQPICGEKQDG
jgi:hypothetical protein